MKYKFVISLSILSSALLAQFSVSGQIESYVEKPVLVKIFDNGDLRLIKNTTTDSKGNFTTTIPTEYNGFVRVDLPSGESVSLLTDNKNIKFKTARGQDYKNSLEVIEGDAQKEYDQSLVIRSFADVQKQVFPYLMQLYKPTDEFYTTIIKEDKRINSLKASEQFSDLVNYVNSLNDLAQQAKANNNQQIQNNIISHFINDDERLEHSGLFNNLLFAYFNLRLAQGNNQNIENRLINITDDILEKTDIQTTRGQNVLNSILSFITEKDYPNFHKIYVKKVNGLTCKITDELKKRTQQSIIKIGDIVPNIKFDQAVKGKKSLYDIKANRKLILFWASWCPACQKEIPYLKEFYKEFKSKGGEVVAISLDYDQNDFKKATQGFEWYNYSDFLKWDSPIAEKFGIDSTPTLLLIDKDNKLIAKTNHVSELENL